MTREALHGVFPENRALKRCGARTRAGSPCLRFPVRNRSRCRLHGGASTGPKTPAGRERIGRATRARYVAAALASGWQFLSEASREKVVLVLRYLSNSKNGTANALGISTNGLRRVLSRLPLRPEEFRALESE